MSENTAEICDTSVVSTKKRWSPEISIARAIAILLVVFGHSFHVSISTFAGGVDYSGVFQNSSSLACAIDWIIYNIYAFHMPLFVFVSGVTYGTELSCGKVISARNLIGSKFRRLIVPYLLFALLWVIPIKLVAGFYSIDDIYKIIVYGFGLGYGAGHLWFLMMLFGIFVTIALMGSHVKNWRFVALLGITLSIAVKIFGGSLPEVFCIRSVISMFIYFAAGVIAAMPNVFNISGLSVRAYWRLAAFSGGGFIVASLIRSSLKAWMHYSITCYPILGLCGSLFVFAMAGIIVRSNFAKMHALLTFIDRRAFRIYLFHDPINYLILLAFCDTGILKSLGDGGNIGVASFVAIRFFGCLGISLCLNALLNFATRSIFANKVPATDSRIRVHS